RRRELDAARIAADRDVAVRLDDAREPREHVAADVVDRAGPVRGFERALTPEELGARDALARAESGQIIEMFDLARDRVRFVTCTREDVDRERADAAGRAGD